MFQLPVLSARGDDLSASQFVPAVSAAGDWKAYLLYYGVASDRIVSMVRRTQIQAEEEMTANEEAEQLVWKAIKAYRDDKCGYSLKDLETSLMKAVLEQTNLAALIEERDAWKRDAEDLKSSLSNAQFNLVSPPNWDTRANGDLMDCAGRLEHHRALVEKYK